MRLEITNLSTELKMNKLLIIGAAPITGSETIGITEPEPKVFDGFNVEKDYVLFMAKGEPWTLKPGINVRASTADN